MEQLKNTALALFAGFGTVVANALGGWDKALAVLVGFMVADYITGMVVVGVFKKSGKSKNGALESRAGFKGLCKKMAVLLVVWMAVMLDGVTGSAFIRTAVCLFFIANEGLSILENFAVMGVPFPKFLKDMLEIMQETADKATK